MSATKTEKQLRKKILSLIGQKIPIKFKGPQGIGNSWLLALGLRVDSKPIADWDGIEIKSLTFEGSLKRGSDLTLFTKTPDWKTLAKFGITNQSFFNKTAYNYNYRGKALFFTKQLRYVVSKDSRTIVWYVLPKNFMPTEPYSKAPARAGKIAFTWNIPELFGKVQKLSITLVKKNGDYPNGTFMPVRSYIINMIQERFVELLYDGSIRYEVRRTQKKDYGTGFRMSRPVLNSLLSLADEIM